MFKTFGALFKCWRLLKSKIDKSREVLNFFHSTYFRFFGYEKAGLGR